MGKWIKKVAGGTPLTVIAKVIDSLNVTTNNRVNAPSIRAVNEAINNNWLTIYPIGSIYMSVNNNDPSVIFGGTWQKIEDKFLLASGEKAIGSTGGAETFSYTPSGSISNHTMAAEELIAHPHKIETTGDKYVKVATSGGALLKQDDTGSIRITNGNIDEYTEYAGQATPTPHNHNFTGTAQTINKMPPYVVVNVWVRTA